MKRGSSGYGGSGDLGGVDQQQASMKRSRAGSGSDAMPGGGGAEGAADQYEVRILIPSRTAGSIIGKGGSNIQKLRTENNASVRVPDCPGPERIMTIQGEEPDNVLNVIEQTLPLMIMSNSNEAVEPVKQQELRILIHQSIVGGVIGRSGSKIKEIRESTGSQIKVYQVCAPQSTDRCVMVQGGPEKIVAAVKQIMEIVDTTEVKGVVQPYDPNNFDGYYAHEYGGFGSEMDVAGYQGSGSGSGGTGSGMMGGGRGGRGSGGGSGGYPVDFNGGYPSSGGRMGSGGSAGGSHHRGGGGYIPQGGSSGYRGNRSNMGGGGGSRSSGGAPGRMFGAGGDAAPPQGFASGGGAADDGGKVETTQVTIPKEMAGAIIGPGGARIRKIRSDSKATITIDEPLPGCAERIITISGTQRGIQMAQFLLQQSVREHDNHYGMGGASGGGGGGAPGRY